MGFNENLKVARLAKGITLRDLAKEVGITYQALSQFERGGKYPSSSTLLAIGKSLNVTLDYLMCNEGVSVEAACTIEVKRATNAQEERRERARADLVAQPRKEETK